MKQNHTSPKSAFETVPTSSPLLRLRERCLWPSSGPGSQWWHLMAASEYRKTLQWCWTAACSGGLCSWPGWDGHNEGQKVFGCGISSSSTSFNIFFYFTKSEIYLHYVLLSPRTLNCSLWQRLINLLRLEKHFREQTERTTTSYSRTLLGSSRVASNSSKTEFMIVINPCLPTPTPFQ